MYLYFAFHRKRQDWRISQCNECDSAMECYLHQRRQWKEGPRCYLHQSHQRKEGPR